MSALYRIILAGIALVSLLACGAQPAPTMLGAQRFEARVDGRDYVVFLKGNQAEIIRLGWAAPGAHHRIRATMMELVPDLTGCALVPSTWQGDSGEMRGRVTCSTDRR